MAGLSGVHEADIGYYTGIIASSYSFGQIFSNYFWGWASDKVGARVVLMFSVSSTAMCLALFGLSTTVWQAVLWRVCSGLLNGNSTILKSYLGKITNTESQKVGVSVLLVSFGVGASVFQIVGGVLSDPSKNMPGVFSDRSVFVTHPYFFPCFLASCYIVFVAFVVGLGMKEADEVKEYYGIEASKSSFLSAGKGACSKLGDSQNEFDFEDGIPLNELSVPHISGGGRRRVSNSGKLYEKLDDTEVFKVESERLSGAGMQRNEKGEFCLSDILEMDGLPNFRRNMVLASLAYALTGLITGMIEESVPLFSKLDVERGGLGYSTAQVGTLLTIGSIAVIIETVLGIPWILRKLGLRRSFALAFVGLIPVVLTFPSLNIIASKMSTSGENVIVFGIFAIIQCCKGLCSAMLYGSVILIITNSVPENFLGQAHGIGQSLVAIARLLGPIISGALFSLIYYSLSEMAFYKWYLWLVFCLFCLLGLGWGLLLDETIEETYMEMAFSRFTSITSVTKHENENEDGSRQIN